MRRCLILIVAAACALAGCGSSSSSSSNPLTTELSYLPANSPLVLTVATDPSGPAIHGVQALINRFPFASLGIGALKQRLQQSGVNYDGDIRPQLGNPIAVALPPGAFTTTQLASQVLIVWKSKDAGKLKSVIQRAVPGLRQTGTRNSAAVYTAGSTGAVAIDGDTAVFSSSVASVDSALDRHAHGGGVTEAQYSKAFSSLPQNAFVNVFGDLTSVLSTPAAASARSIPWVAAVRGYAETITASSSGLTFSYHVDTRGTPLTASQLPFAPGTAAPGLAGGLPITLGIHDPAQIASFIESARQATNPSSYAAFLNRQAALRARTGADLNSLIKLMTGDLIVASDTKTTMGRVTVSDPAAATTTLDKLATAPRSVFKGSPLRRSAGSFEILPRHGGAIRIAIVGNQLVVGKATLSQLRQFAVAPSSPAPGAHGSVAFRVSLNQLLTLVLKQSPSQAVESVLSQLSDITGSNSVSPSGLTGSATIGVR